MGSWTREAGTVTLFVDDLAEASQFYEDVFGLPVRSEDDDSTVFDLGHTLIELRDGSDRPQPRPPASVVPSGLELELGGPISIEVVDLEAACERLAARGVTLLAGPSVRRSGARIASFRDPGGHLWEIAA